MNGPRVRIVQALCPARHCIIGAAYSTPDGEEDAGFPERIREKYEALGGEMKCGICGSTEIQWEDRPSIFKTMEEAAPVMKLAETAQLITRLQIEAARKAERN